MHSWESAFADFLASATAETKKILSGIQYYHECRASAAHHTLSVEMVQALEGTATEDKAVEQTPEGGKHQTLTEEMLTDLVASQQTSHEEWHGLLAIEAAKLAKIFDGSEDEAWREAPEPEGMRSETMQLNMQGMCVTSAMDLEHLLLWKQQMTADVQKQNPAMDPCRSSDNDSPDRGDVDILCLTDTSDTQQAAVWYIGDTETSEQSLSAVDPALLHYDQFRAYDIITAHLDATLAGQRQPPLRMLIHGEPGTGKSKVIQTATEYFVHRGANFMLQKAAYTGIAASLIDGKTTHTIAMLSPRKVHSISAKTKGKLQAHWKYIQYLVIDELSMISKSFLAKLSCNISIGKMSEGQEPSPHSFRGVSVILCGDFFQFPPVACAPSEALYFPTTTVVRNQEDTLVMPSAGFGMIQHCVNTGKRLSVWYWSVMQKTR